MKRSISFCVSKVPVGLFGLAMKMSRVRGVIAAMHVIEMMTHIGTRNFDGARAENRGD